MKNMPAISQWQKRFFAWGMAQANATDSQRIQLREHPHYANMAELKKDLLGNLSGSILEIGPGAGANFVYYPHNIRWIGVEPNPYMHQYLHREATEQGIEVAEIHASGAENLPVADGSVDAVVSTHVLCSVGDLEPTLQEIQRVLKAGGTFTFMEHVADRHESLGRKVQNAIAPIWKTLFDNCHPNRETWVYLQKAGFESVQYHDFQLPFPIVHPHIAGVATKATS
jgi:ubiquinone/menaquinone biosynthesis C-methylase UbiE